MSNTILKLKNIFPTLTLDNMYMKVLRIIYNTIQYNTIQYNTIQYNTM